MMHIMSCVKTCPIAGAKTDLTHDVPHCREDQNNPPNLIHLEQAIAAGLELLL